ncbi:MAG: hypothetical protein LBJ08_03015, partial [Bifidobacteriaceae bacterium]|nr:hypothetical protein [Bifidobacteriaceae bacterium]
MSNRFRSLIGAASAAAVSVTLAFGGGAAAVPLASIDLITPDVLVNLVTGGLHLLTTAPEVGVPVTADWDETIDLGAGVQADIDLEATEWVVADTPGQTVGTSSAGNSITPTAADVGKYLTAKVSGTVEFPGLDGWLTGKSSLYDLTGISRADVVAAIEQWVTDNADEAAALIYPLIEQIQDALADTGVKTQIKTAVAAVLSQAIQTVLEGVGSELASIQATDLANLINGAIPDASELAATAIVGALQAAGSITLPGPTTLALYDLVYPGKTPQDAISDLADDIEALLMGLDINTFAGQLATFLNGAIDDVIDKVIAGALAGVADAVDDMVDTVLTAVSGILPDQTDIETWIASQGPDVAELLANLLDAIGPSVITGLTGLTDLAQGPHNVSFIFPIQDPVIQRQLAPVVPPSLSYTQLRRGFPVTVNAGDWGDLASAVNAPTVEWFVGGASKGTSASYTPVAADVGLALTATVTVAPTSGGTAQYYKSWTGTIGGGIVGDQLMPVPALAPYLITTSPVVGQDVAFNQGSWPTSGDNGSTLTPTPSCTWTYLWPDNSTESGGTGCTYSVADTVNSKSTVGAQLVLGFSVALANEAYRNYSATFITDPIRDHSISGTGTPSTYTAAIPDPAPANNAALRAITDDALTVVAPTWTIDGVNVPTSGLTTTDTISFKMVDAAGDIIGGADYTTGGLVTDPLTLAQLSAISVWDSSQGIFAIGKGLLDSQLDTVRGLEPGVYHVVVTLTRTLGGSPVSGEAWYDVWVTRPAEMLLGQTATLSGAAGVTSSGSPYVVDVDSDSYAGLSGLTIDASWLLNGTAESILDTDSLSLRIVSQVTGSVPGSGLGALQIGTSLVSVLKNSGVVAASGTTVAVNPLADLTPQQEATLKGLPSGSYDVEVTVVRGDIASTPSSAILELVRAAGEDPIVSLRDPELSTLKPVAGVPLNVIPGDFDPSSVNVDYDWEVDGSAPSPGKVTNNALTLTTSPDDEGYRVGLTVTASLDGYTSWTRSYLTDPVVLPKVHVVSAAVLSTTQPIVGESITLLPGTYDPTSATETITWTVTGGSTG